MHEVIKAMGEVGLGLMMLGAVLCLVTILIGFIGETL